MPNELKCGITFVFLALLAFAVCFFPIPSRKKVRPLGRDKELLELSSGPPHFSCRFPYRRKSLNQIRFGGVGKASRKIWDLGRCSVGATSAAGVRLLRKVVPCRVSHLSRGAQQSYRWPFLARSMSVPRFDSGQRALSQGEENPSPPKIRHLHAPWVVHHIMDDRPWRTASQSGENNRGGTQTEREGERERVRFTHFLTAHTHHSL